MNLSCVLTEIGLLTLIRKEDFPGSSLVLPAAGQVSNLSFGNLARALQGFQGPAWSPRQQFPIGCPDWLALIAARIAQMHMQEAVRVQVG